MPRTWLLSLTLTAACTSSADAVVQPGVLIEEGMSDISAPDSAAAGASLDVDIKTWGSPCVTDESDVVTQTPDGGTIAVYDRWPKENCASVLVAIHHIVTMKFPTTGTKNLFITGWDSRQAEISIPITIDITP
jgi:hypothetical protein